MLLYGGLIGSRTGTETLEEIKLRLTMLEKIRRLRPRLRLYVSTTVMRMPQYSSSDEEPDYYADYGREIFLYSQFTHRYEVLQQDADHAQAESYRQKIPPAVLSDYLRRRERNFLINQALIALVKRGVIDRLTVTMDDNAEFGLFKKEAAALEKLSSDVRRRVAIYPGADEAQLTMLSHLVSANRRVPVFVAYRFPQAKRLIPAFEGQPLEDSIKRQIAAAGGSVSHDLKRASCLLYVNNFQEKNTFAGQQPPFPLASGEPFEAWLRRAGVEVAPSQLLIIADNRYFNGSDTELIASLFASPIVQQRLAYAGWNTSGNTLGSAISLGVLRWYSKAGPEVYRRLLWARFMEDWAYMVEGREMLRRDMQQRGVNQFGGTPLEAGYETLLQRHFNQRATLINRFLHSNYRVGSVFFPWHRLFEAGFTLEAVTTKTR
jgi:hypothetical protein